MIGVKKTVVEAEQRVNHLESQLEQVVLSKVSMEMTVSQLGDEKRDLSCKLDELQAQLEKAAAEELQR